VDQRGVPVHLAGNENEGPLAGNIPDDRCNISVIVVPAGGRHAHQQDDQENFRKVISHGDWFCDDVKIPK
jgi:hypothetical protein